MSDRERKRMDDKKLLQIENLHVHYMSDGREVKAVNGISLEVGEGETIGLVGETGAGKTTLALAIMRLVQKPAGRYVDGEILFHGENLLKTSEAYMNHIRGNQISMIFQDPMTSLNPVYTVGDQIAEVIALHEHLNAKEAMARAGEALEMVGIPRERAGEYPHQFSGGMKQRVCIAMALAANPQLLIADEPTTALDVTIQAQVLDLMGKLKRELKTAMILITHDLGIVSEVCDKVAIVYAGRIIEYGTCEDIYRNPQHPYTVGLFHSIPKLDRKIARLTPIKGLMPDPANLPAGCAFAPRCNHACPACTQTEPQMEAIGETHRIACLRHREIAAGKA